MTRKLILLFPVLLLTTVLALAQTSGKSKSKDRLREKDDRRYPVTIKNSIAINSPGIDFAPAYYQEGLIYVSTRAKNGPRDSNDEPYSQFYQSSFDPNGDPSPPVKFDFDARKISPLHDGPLCFSRDFKVVYFTRTNNKDGVRKASKSGKSKLKIYAAEYGKEDWTKPLDLDFNSDEYNCVHPSLSPDGTKLFFSSDMPGGIGGYDLYVREKLPDGTWASPRNLGPAINTEKNDLYPFISYSGTLFFSSNGRANSLGGLDLYYVNYPLGSADEVEVINMNAPFNSEGDDKSFIIDPDGKTGFFASDRAKGYGKEDIYRFEASRGLEGFGKLETNLARFNVTDAKTGEPLKDAEIRILQASSDGLVSGNNNFYSVSLLPVQDQKNALSLQIVRKDAEDMGLPELYSNVQGEARTEFNRYRTYLVLVSLNGYRTMERFFSVESPDDVTLNFKMAEAPLCIRSGGLVLSSEFGTRIAAATVRFVNRITNDEVKARSTLNGDFDACLPTDGDYVVYVEKQGFKPANFRLNAARGDRSFNEVKLQPLVEGIAIEESMPLSNGLYEGSVIILDRIFYEYNKATLNQKAIQHLEALLELLKRYPEMEIELIAHTDTRGETKLNQELTDERAKNAKSYLTFRGIETSRINAYGKGESEPRNRCVDGTDDCSDDEHQQNNRLEIRVKKLGKVLRP
jgi:outer membrane protein OmpA-like peptidoglycan-associated protein